MNIGLIAFSGLRVKNERLAKLGLTLPGFIERKKVIASLPSLGLLTLAGMTPENISVEYIEVQDLQSDLNILNRFDLVAISSFSAQIYEAYKLADQLRASGTTVVLGGLHVSALPKEACQHADSVVIGEAENCWPTLLKDFHNKQLKSFYNGSTTNYDLCEAPMPRFDLLDIKKYNRITVQTQRGCPFQCEYCASSIRISSRFKHKPIDKVIAEIREIKNIWRHPFIELADDNTFANKNHSKKLVKALAAEDIKWFTETDISIAEDHQLMDLLADSGCRQLLIGFESPSRQALNNIELKANWKQQQLDKYFGAIDALQSRGISVNGCFVMGMDGSDSSSFDATYDFVKKSGLAEVQITLLTPFPGTELYQRLKAEKRLLKDVFWDECTLFDVTYIPKYMSVSDLERGFETLMERLYTEEFATSRKKNFLKMAKSHSRLKA